MVPLIGLGRDETAAAGRRKVRDEIGRNPDRP
jgi:hypothetical protein